MTQDFIPAYFSSKGIESRDLNNYLYANVYHSIIHNSHRWNNPMSTNKWMDKQNVVYAYNEILFSRKKEWGSDTCYNVDEPWKYYMLSEITQTQDKYIVWFHFYEISRIGKFIDK